MRACWGKHSRHTDFVKVMLQNGVDPRETSPDGRSLLQHVRGNPATSALIEDHIKRRREAL
jgi:hypothetical protein